MRQSRREPWVVLSQTNDLRWGGDLRRHHIFRALAGRTGAQIDPAAGRVALRRAVRGAAGPPWPWRRHPFVASSDLLTAEAVRLARRVARPVALDVHDHSVAQADALGRRLEPEARVAQLSRIQANLDLFPLHVVPSASFAALVGLDAARVVVAPNGTDTTLIRPAPVPPEPIVGFVSGAAPGRGIESLIEAVRLARGQAADLRLRLWLAAVDEVSRAYVDHLRAATAGEPWVEIGSVPYAGLARALASATLFVLPHPANAYLDVAVPVKLMDAMAAGRPVVVTPRAETRRIVERCACGVIVPDDSPAEMARAILALLADHALAARLGANGRRAAEDEFDWQHIGDRVADAILARVAVGLA